MCRAPLCRAQPSRPLRASDVILLPRARAEGTVTRARRGRLAAAPRWERGCWGSNPGGRDAPLGSLSQAFPPRRAAGDAAGAPRAAVHEEAGPAEGPAPGAWGQQRVRPEVPPTCPPRGPESQSWGQRLASRAHSHHRVFIKHPLCAKGVPKTWNQVNAFPLLTAADSGISQEGVIMGVPRHSWGFRRGNDSSVQRLP